MSGSDEIEEQYPVACPFCVNGRAHPPSSSSQSSSDSPLSAESLLSCIPNDVDIDKTSPPCFLVLSAPNVMAFLDILPMTRGHLLVTSRSHKRKVEDMEAEESRDIGFWLPLLATAVRMVTGSSDYNLVQNNGARAAQVVPHVHFHIIPRPAHVPEIKARSWSMFGRGQREDLDDDEGAEIAAEIRKELRKVVIARFGSRNKL